MASSSREDRQKMRQRGAGTRNIGNVDSRLAFSAVPQNSREERQLMRQRGAGTRKIDNIDFGIAFPTPNRTRSSATKTPQTAQSSRQPSKTPSRASRGPPASRSVRGSSASDRRNSSKRNDVYEVPEGERTEAGPSMAKKRKPNHAYNLDIMKGNAEYNGNAAGQSNLVSCNITDGADISVSRASASRRRTASKAPIAIAEEPEDETEPSAPHPLLLARLRQDLDPESISQHGGDKENVVPTTKKGQKRKKRKSIGQQSTRRKKRSSGSSVLMPLQPTLTEAQDDIVPDISGSDDQDSANRDQDAEQPELEPPQQGSVLVAIETSPPVKAKRRKRKSVVLVRKKRRPSGEVSRRTSEWTQLSTLDDSGEGREILSCQNIEGEAEAESSEYDIRLPNRGVKPSARRRRTSPQFHRSHPARIVPEGDGNGDETYVHDETSEPTTPVITERSRKRGSNNRMLPLIEQDHGNATRKYGRENGTRPKTKKTRSTFPILTHRLVNSGALPTIDEEGEDLSDADDDLNSASARFPDRVAPNAVDVLAQICRETLDTAISKVAATTNSANGRADTKRKRTALEAFSKELDGRLFEMSAAVENRLTLESRLKKSKREKADLEARWIEVRRQREEIALKCDAVRRKNWESEADEKERHELSKHLHNLEMVMERESGEVEDGLEFMLRSVAGRVSGADGPGPLDRVKEFNRQLERVAAALEGRL